VGRLCHNAGIRKVVILSPPPVILSEAKDLNLWVRMNSTRGLGIWLRACPEGTEGINSMKNLIISTESIVEILPCPPAGRGYRLRHWDTVSGWGPESVPFS